ncbi:hypothetical protein [Teichococcus aestuarii]|uniref:hypothetical protein n=1 Tax=Teichococcus aestuarii TaxID=568898 RepID=UPI0036143213
MAVRQTSGMAGIRQAGCMAAAPPPEFGQSVTLRASNGKPLRMRAVLLAEASNAAPRLRDWHEVSLWRRQDGEIVLALRTHLHDGPEPERCRIMPFPDLEQAMRWLEEFDPLQDLQAVFDAFDPQLIPLVVSRVVV